LKRRSGRARNIESPECQGFQTDTPCVKGELRCYDCDRPRADLQGPSRILAEAERFEEGEVVIIDEDLVY
jgi:hypothetical protein